MAESIPNLAKEPVKQVQEALSLKQDVRKETIMKTHNKTSNYPTGLMAKKKNQTQKTEYKQEKWVSWWFSGEESTCQCRKHGFDPWSRKGIPEPLVAAKQLSMWATAPESESNNY